MKSTFTYKSRACLKQCLKLAELLQAHHHELPHIQGLQPAEQSSVLIWSYETCC